MSIENLPLPSSVRYRIESAPRVPGTEYPAAPWRTVRGKTGLTLQEAVKALQDYQSTATTLYRPTSYTSR